MSEQHQSDASQRLSEYARNYRRGLFLITQHFSLRVPDLQAVPVDYVMIWT
jgi:hypothetical protein